MICRVDGRVSRGRVVTVGVDVAPAALALAVRTGTATDGDNRITVACRRPHPVHERVGCIEPGMGFRPRTALAAAGRARGLATPVDRELRAARRRLAEFEVEPPRTADARRSVAAADAETDRLRERVATARGRVEARRTLEGDPGEAAGDLAEAVAELSEVETRAVAARETYERRRETAREARDRLEERRRQADLVANLERTARARLVARLRPAYEAALVAVPGSDPPADPFEASADAMALAVARVARVRAPVVLACDRFSTPQEATRWLAGPVLWPAA